MKQELIQKNASELKIKNKDIKICINCGNSKWIHMSMEFHVKIVVFFCGENK